MVDGNVQYLIKNVTHCGCKRISYFPFQQKYKTVENLWFYKYVTVE